MLQNQSTNRNFWWDTEPSIATETTRKAAESKYGLDFSRWADASSYGKPPVFPAASRGNVTPFEQESHKIDYRFTGVNSDLEMDHGFSFIAPSHVSKMSGFNTLVAQLDHENWRGVAPQHQSITHDRLLDAPVDFISEVAMIDDDGDVIMMDLNDPSTIMMVDQVARDERQAETTSEYADSRPELRPTVSSPRISNPSCVLVIDTSFILSHLQLVDNLARSHTRWRNVVVIPWATIQELDGLKKSVRQNNGIDVSKLARNAISWAYSAFGKRDPGVWGQIKEEKYDDDATHGDPAILDCCRYFHRVRGHNTILLTHDKNLGVQAMMNSIGIVQMNGSTPTAESILSRLGLNSANTRAAPVPNERSFISFPAKPVPVKTDPRKIQPPFYPTSDVDSPYLQYGTKKMGITPLKSSGGLHDSIYAHERKMPTPKFPTAKLSSTQPASSRKCNVEIKKKLNSLLQEISGDLVTNLVPLLRKCTLEKLGGADTLQHLNIVPERQVHSIPEIESFFNAHWMTVFTEIFPGNLQQVFGNGMLNRRYARWVYWTEFNGPDTAEPGKMEIRKWIEEWDFIWKRMIYTERETMVNMDTVDGWRNALVKVGLFN